MLNLVTMAPRLPVALKLQPIGGQVEYYENLAALASNKKKFRPLFILSLVVINSGLAS